MSICPKCGGQTPSDRPFCQNCGYALSFSAQSQNSAVTVPVTTSHQSTHDANTFVESMLPEKFKPLSGWSYFGYYLLFSLPAVGFILLIIFSLDNNGNINRRNFARGLLISYIIAAVIIFIMFILLMLTAEPITMTEFLPTAPQFI
ncbi:MAG: zinc ribbon domain-containing protein [Clostridia bacterium]|nr:zinc ribbon domain-containing protein [Clostridia bacterium]